MAADYTFTNADYYEVPVQEFLEVGAYYGNYQLSSHVELTETGSGGGLAKVPAIVRATGISSDSTAALSTNVSIPSNVVVGDLMIACIMYRETSGTITVPTGWSLQGTYSNNMILGQRLLVYGKTAEAGDPGSSAQWSTSSSGLICHVFLATEGDATIEEILEVEGNGQSASISTTSERLNFTVANWIYSLSPDPQVYSQSGIGVTEISDSPIHQARISGGYTVNATTVTSVTEGINETSNPPNHVMINIKIYRTIAGGSGGDGGGEPCPGLSWQLFPRR